MKDQYMKYMLCKHRVKDFSKWHTIFLSHKDAQEKAGFRLLHLLRDTKDAYRVVYLFALKDLDSALAFTETPEAYETAKISGVIGEVEMMILSDEI
jgi:hypothetical protein